MQPMNLLWFLVIVLILGTVNSTRQELKKMLEDVDNIYRYTDVERQDFIEYFSHLLVEEIQFKAKSVLLDDEYQRVRFGIKYGMLNKATISLHSGVTSRPTFYLVNTTVNDYSSNYVEFNTRVIFDNIRLTYYECKLNISGTKQHGSLSANVSNFQGVFTTQLDFKENGWRWLRRPSEVLGNVREITNPNVELGLRENSRDLFVIYANMVEAKDLEEIFRRQIIKVFNVLILDGVDSIYQSLKTIH